MKPRIIIEADALLEENKGLLELLERYRAVCAAVLQDAEPLPGDHNRVVVRKAILNQLRVTHTL